MPDEEFEADLAATIAEMAAEGEGQEPEEETEENELEADDEQPEEDDDLEADDEEEQPEEDDDLETDDASPDLEAAQAAVDAGDLEALAKALGKDASAFDVSKRQFKAMRAGLAEAKAKAAKAEKDKRDADSVSTAAQKTYGPIVLARKAVTERATGWEGQARAALEMIGFAPDVLAKLVGAEGDAAAPAEETEVDKLRRELRERDARLEQEQARARAEAEVKAQQTEVLAKLKGTPLEGREYAAQEIVELVRKSYDPTTKGYGLTIKAAYRQVKGKYVLGEPASKPTKKKARRRLTKVRTEKKPKVLTEEEEFQADILAAQREAEAEERAARRARGAR